MDSSRRHDPRKVLRVWIIAIGLTLIAAFVASSVYDAWRLNAQITAATERELANLARALAEEADRSLQAADLLLTDTALWYQSTGRMLDAKAIEANLMSRASTTPYVSVLSLVDADGQQRYRSRQAAAGLTNVADRPYFIAQRDKLVSGMFINPPIVTRTDLRPAVVVSRRLEIDGKFAGVVTGIVALDDLRQVYDAIMLDAHSSLILTFDDGLLVIRHPPTARAYVGSRFAEISALRNQPAARLISPVDGREKFMVAVSVAERHLVLAVTRDTQDALSPWRQEMGSMVPRNVALTIVGLLTIALLIRQLKRVDAGEQALRQSEERYALAMEAAKEGHAEWNVDGGSVFASERWRGLHGLPAHTPICTLEELLPLLTIEPQDYKAVRLALAEHLAGRTAEVELEYRVDIGGTWRWIQMRGRCLRDEHGRPMRFFCAATDISARKQAEDERVHLEAQLRQAQHMEALGTLAGGIAHDFNNILGAILGHGEMAQRDAAAGSALRRHIDRVMQGGARAKLLVRRILDFSRSGVREGVLVNLQTAVEENLLLLAPSLPSSVRLSTELHGGSAAILGDPTQIHQLVSNLCNNAVAAMPDGGELSLKLERLDLTVAQRLSHGTAKPGAVLRLSIRDTGTGITPEVYARMFDPFFSTKSVGEGTGLGLSVVHSVVADLGGAIDVQTAPGEGSTFSLCLPVAGELAPGPAEASAELPRGRGQTVMIVDDEAALLEAAEEMLAQLGYEPVGFASSAAALQAFKLDPQRFDAVLSDETMPQLSGTQLTEQLLSSRPDLPVIIMSGYGGEQLAAKAKSAGARLLLNKPLAMRDIAEGLARVLVSPAPVAG